MAVSQEDLDVLARLVNERGYLVAECYEQRNPGDIMDHGLCYGNTIEQPLHIVSETTRDDYIEQCRLVGWVDGVDALPVGGVWFYRVITD